MPDNEGQRILLFGGAFDPPHKGHVNLLQNAVAAAAPSLVLVVPEGTAPHKAASGTPWPLRAAMCRCFLPVFPHVHVSDVEHRRAGKSYTCDTMRQLQEENPGAAFFLVMGGDMLESFFTWRRWQDILRRATLVAAPRHAGEEATMQKAAAELRQAGGRVIFAPGPVLAASSSGIRAALAAGDEGALALVPSPADELIRQNGLYRSFV